MIPTRWRMRIEEQLDQAEARVTSARANLTREEGGAALQSAYQAVVDAATLRVWHAAPPWTTTLSPAEMRDRVRGAFPNLFAALSGLDLSAALTSPWTADAVEPYVDEARAFVAQVATELRQWLSAS